MASDASKPLTPRQAAFVSEYLVDLNGTQAAIRAGYSPATANEQASRLLTDVSVADAVERGKAQRLSRVNISADAVVHEISLLANSSIEHYRLDEEGQLRPTEDAPEGAMRAVKSLKRKSKVFRDKDGNVSYTEYDVTFELWDKPGQLKLMGKHAGVKACFDKVELVGKDDAPLTFSLNLTKPREDV